MAKKTKAKIQLSKAEGDSVEPLSFADSSDLPAYHHYVDAPDHSYRLFFEEPHSENEIIDLLRPAKKFYRAKNSQNPFRIVGNGADLIGADIAKTFAIIISKEILKGNVAPHQSQIFHTVVKNFFTYLATLSSPPKSFVAINITHISNWLSYVGSPTASRYKLAIRRLFASHPQSQHIDIKSIRLFKNKHGKRNLLKEIDIDEIVKAKDYSEKVHFQLLAYVYFEIELAQKRLSELENASVEQLGCDYIALDQLKVNNPVIKRLLESGGEGFAKLLYHFYLHIKDEQAGRRVSKTKTNHALFVSRLAEISALLFPAASNPFDRFKRFYQMSQPQAWPLREGNIPPIFDYLSLTSKHHEVAIFLYALITTGVNKEVVLSWQRIVDGKPWFENYDIQLGVTDKVAQRDKRIVLVGVKKKGGQPKSILKSISVNSPLFHYLKLLDKTRSPQREFLFSVRSVFSYFSAFLRHYPVITDDGERLETLDTRRIRKSYIGYKTFSLLESVKNADELVLKLREALNHKSFDTTFSSYIMKSGMGRTVIDSAVVALTTDMLEKSMVFAGKIKEDSERSANHKAVFLCDCTDPSKPTHGLPVAGRCMKYDMCLGCMRSEVYAEHLPAVCYRILQYEEKLATNPDVFKITLEDKLHIARDTVEKFKTGHSSGMALVEQAYVIANDAMRKNTPLLPPILQTETELANV